MAYYKLQMIDDFGIGAASFNAMATAAISGGDIVMADAQLNVM